MLKLVAVGDISLGDQPVCYGHGVRSIIEKHGIDFIFRNILHKLDGQVVFGNLEYILSDIGFDNSVLEKGEFRGRPEYAAGLHRAGFTALSVANNHSIQYGCDAFNDTIKILENNNITPIGISTDTGSNSHTITDSNVNLKIFAYSLRPENYYKGKPLYAHNDTNLLLQQVSDAKKEGSIVVVSLHWGEEYLNAPSPSQIALARKIIDAGTALIIGHHPHVLQGIERYRNGYIAYSLGNFVADFWQPYAKRSAILQCSISENGVDQLDMVPIYINQQYQPTPATGALCDSILHDIESYTKMIAAIEQPGNNYADDEYNKRANEVYRKYRIESYLYFMRNIYKYSPSIIAQSIKRFLGRRLKT